MLGGFFKSPSSTDTDVEAQPLPSEPKPILTHINLRSPVCAVSKEWDTELPATHKSRHDRRGSKCAQSADSAEGLPPHTCSLPSDAEGEEEVTVAEYLFKFGFGASSFHLFLHLLTKLFMLRVQYFPCFGLLVPALYARLSVGPRQPCHQIVHCPAKLMQRGTMP